jgi:hypothetical protein
MIDWLFRTVPPPQKLAVAELIDGRGDFNDPNVRWFLLLIPSETETEERLQYLENELLRRPLRQDERNYAGYVLRDVLGIPFSEWRRTVGY